MIFHEISFHEVFDIRVIENVQRQVMSISIDTFII